MGSSEERRDAIANSRKPYCEILDFAGNSGRHKLVNAVDILGGKVSDEAIEMAREKIREAKGPVNVQEVLKEMEETKREMDERKAREAAMRDKIRAKASFSTVDVDPFDVFHIQPVKARGWDRAKTLSDKQRDILLKQGIDPDGMPYGQAKQLLNEVFRRWHSKLSSFKQARILRKNGITAPMRHEEASRMIDAIAQRNGWRRRA
jgi:ribosomal protein S28E/S33